MEDTNPIILIVDDDEAHAEATSEVLDRANRDYECLTARNGEEAQKLLAARDVDLVLLDLKLPDIDGMTLLQVTRERNPDTEVIIMTGYGSVTYAVEALQKGAFSFLEKPLQRDHLRNQVAKALERKALATDNRRLRALVDDRGGFDGMIGQSEPMLLVFDRIRQVAPTDARVLITGPNGSGKELVARALHNHSARKAKRLVAFNCAAITGDLLQSELFGHVKGAYTGADSNREGKFEYAKGGTLFLDEIGEMPLEAQAKLLRVLETSEVTRLGSNESIPVDVRLISATNKNLEDEVRLGRFREDLYFRLKVIQIHMPPLHQRGHDIILLAESFLREFSVKYGRRVDGFEPAVADALMRHSWPGNVRELRNTVEELTILSSGSRIGFDALGSGLRANLVPELPASTAEAATLPSANRYVAADPDSLFSALVGTRMEDIEKGMIKATLEACDGNREQTAEKLGIGQRTLYRKINEFSLRGE